jgi:hypothetical protein
MGKTVMYDDFAIAHMPSIANHPPAGFRGEFRLEEN